MTPDEVLAMPLGLRDEMTRQANEEIKARRR